MFTYIFSKESSSPVYPENNEIITPLLISKDERGPENDYGVIVSEPNTPILSLQNEVEHERIFTQPKDYWTPNDQLYEDFDHMIKIINQTKSLTNKINEIENRIKSTKIQLTENNICKNLLERAHKLELKQSIMEEESKILGYTKEINKQQNIDTSIFDKWEKYLTDAENFIKDRPLLHGIIGPNDILTSEGIYIRARHLIDSAKFGNRNKQYQEKIENLKIFSNFFDLIELHKKSRGQNLIEFRDFFSTLKNELNIFDDLDVKSLLIGRVTNSMV